MRYGTRDLPSVEVGVFSEFWIYFFMNLPGLRTETIFKEKTKLLFVIPSKWESLNKMTEM